ncbi:uncharacterized protein PV07_00346 [Cladophialophora immunda]|uniref:Uncharacterized protein n=1 Tax=Cladophialophora immunda TaxID=569365 RepID=A0A0D2CUI6_9EURO|nr:uncharacterized protein PV07_00346 [Cladophialophora immunda]KIW33500.1 hypothetical protein PV07_00346 [Cladophialophora immunda]OQV09657.1 hypothetical protein CLAIMM_13757 [Cladophialophora immunda]
MGLIKTAMIAGVGIYAVNKITKSAENRRTNPAPAAAAQDSASRQRYFDAPPCYYSDPYQAGQTQQQRQQYQPQEKVLPLEFTERRGQHQEKQQLQHQQQGQAQVLLTNNSAYSPLPHGYNHQAAYGYDSDLRTAPEPADMYAGSAPPSHYDDWRQRRPHGFVEPDEVSNSTFDGRSRRGNTRGTGLFDTLAQQVENIRDGKGKDLVGKLLSR